MTVPNESEIFSAISAFEKILEAVPTDRLAIETLADAYDKLGDVPKTIGYLLKLVEVVVHENDTLAAPAIIEKLRAFNREETARARNRLQAMLDKEKNARAAQAEKAAPGAAAPAPAAPGVRKAADITREVALAWELLQSGRFNQADYSMVVQDLSENSTKRVDVPVSVLHALSDRQFKGLEKVVAHLSKMSGAPILPLSSFELNRDAFMLLPMDFLTRRGAICFDVMGSDALVAVLNPVDKDLQEDVQRLLKRRCHFYLVSATDYDSTLANIRKVLAAEAEK
jgi:F0F1-type ATP synthase delta subunit